MKLKLTKLSNYIKVLVYKWGRLAFQQNHTYANLFFTIMSGIEELDNMEGVRRVVLGERITVRKWKQKVEVMVAKLSAADENLLEIYDLSWDVPDSEMDTFVKGIYERLDNMCTRSVQLSMHMQLHQKAVSDTLTAYGESVLECKTFVEKCEEDDTGDETNE